MRELDEILQTAGLKEEAAVGNKGPAELLDDA